MNVTYNPNGAQFFTDGSPSSYMVSFSFAESKTLTREELAEIEGSASGLL